MNAKKLVMALLLGALLVPAAGFSHEGFAGDRDASRFTTKPPYVRYGGYVRKRVDGHGRIIVQHNGRRIVYPRDWHWFSRVRRLQRERFERSLERFR